MSESGSVLFFALILFVIIYCAVRLAIVPLINQPDSPTGDNEEFDLKSLRDAGLLTEKEFTEIIELYWNEDTNKEQSIKYINASKTLMELKNRGYFSPEEYTAKLEKLKQYYN